jgi:ABC-type nitrate/sulfonate/bicarbonate transport system permease component
VQLFWLALLAIAVPFAIFVPNSGPSLHTVGLALGIGAALGVPVGLFVRFVMPLERRLELFRSMNPSLARRVMPPPCETGRDDVEGSGS